MQTNFKILAAGLAAALLSSAAAARAQTLHPRVYLESHADGSRYVRVMEQDYSAFTPVTTVEDRASSPRLNILSPRATLVRNVTVRDAEYGVHITSPSLVSINNLNFVGWNGGGEIYGAAIKINRRAPAATYIQRVFADGEQAPDASYTRSNTDFIGIERNNAPVFVRYATGRRFGDAGVDAKSNVALMNITIDGMHRGLRVWRGATLTIANAIINVPPGHEQVWMQHPSSRLRYYNVLWCVGSNRPSGNDRRCTSDPTAIGVDGITLAQARRQMTSNSSNPLAGNPFFATQIDRVVVEYSSNGGRTWAVLAADGAPGRPPRGDLLYRVPFDLRRGTYLFRAHFERNGAHLGPAVTVNEAGARV